MRGGNRFIHDEFVHRRTEQKPLAFYCDVPLHVVYVSQSSGTAETNEIHDITKYSLLSLAVPHEYSATGDPYARACLLSEDMKR